MLNRLNGKIAHIDFGDCFEVCYTWFVGLFVPVPGLCKKFAFPFFFEVAMTREKFPEKIPFRLTRMLTNAMEV